MTSIRQLIELSISNGTGLDVLVETGENHHANNDSLPLRFCTHFDQDTVINIEHVNSSERQVIEKRCQEIRHKVSGTVLINNKRFHDTTMILSDEKRQGKPFLITIWRNDTNTERGLSELLQRLRKRDIVNPKILMELFPSYDSGKLQTRDDLVVALRLYDQLNNADIELALEESIATNELLSNRIIDLDEYVKQLEQENELQKREINSASIKLQTPTPSDANILVNVIENEQYKNSICTILVFADGSRKQMKLATWDTSHAVTHKAKTLVGRRVITTCWDPKNEPGKWSGMGYFKNIYISTEIEELKMPS